MESRILPIEQIVVDESVYPRCKWGWQTAYDYAMSMKAGAEFPPIVVAELGGRTVLVDGMHRLEAYKQNKESHVQCNILTGLSKDQVYLEAIKRNIINGRPLSSQDKVKVIIDLRKMKISEVEISKIICIPLGKVENFVVDRITNTLTGEQVILKAPMKSLAGVPIDDSAVLSQQVFSANGQMAVVDQMISLMETGAIKLDSKTIVNKLKILRKLIEKAVLKKRK